MRLLVTLILYTQALTSIFFGINVIIREGVNNKENAIIILNAVTLFLWNVSYAVMLNTTETQENLRYASRSVAMIAIILSVIFCSYTLTRWVSLNNELRKRVLDVEILLGFLIYPVIIARESVTFVKGPFGWTYVFNDYPGRGIYNATLAVMVLGAVLMSLYGMLLGKHKRDRIYGRYGFICLLILIVGMMSDTLLPLFGYPVFPGSAVAMFICFCVIYYVYVSRKLGRLTVSNVSSEIFELIDMPILILDEDHRVTIMNHSAGIFFQTTEDRIIDHKIETFFAKSNEDSVAGEQTMEDLDKPFSLSRQNSYDVKCKTNHADCRLRFSQIADPYDEPLGYVLMITDMTDKILMIAELEDYRSHLQEKLDAKSKELEVLILQAITAVANTIDAKDEYTKGHSVRVAHYSALLAEKLGKSEAYVNNIHYMALLHDIGKIGVPDSVLNKNGKLNDAEFALIKQHTSIGAEILKDITMVDGVALGAKYHHERYDGHGYPQGLKGEEIPYEARIIGIADAFDAMTSTRVYRTPLTMEKVLAEFERGKGTQFDPNIIEVFIGMIRNGELSAQAAKEERTIVSESNKLLMNVLERQNEQSRLERDYDYLTGLYNRKSSEREIADYLQKDTGIVMLVDLDHFKEVNDNYGHLLGDMALKETADSMKEAFGDQAVIGREGGDEFLIFLKGISDEEEAMKLAQNLRVCFGKRAQKNYFMQGCSLSIGLSKPAAPNNRYPEMFRQADKAMYYVKQNGRDNVSVYHEEGKWNQENTVRRDIGQIVDIFRNAEQYQGAFSAKAQELRRMYEFARGFSARYHYEMQIVLFTVEFERNGETLERRENAMGMLQSSVRTCLRNVDISTRYGSTQMIVVLVDSTDEGVQVVANKIMSNFYKLYTENAVDIYYDSINIKDI